MTTFYFKSKGTADNLWNVGKLQAENQDDATKELDATYNIERDKSGAQTNSEHVQAALIEKSEYDEHVAAKAQAVKDAKAAAEKDAKQEAESGTDTEKVA